jgi:hypothetical protein
MTTLELKLDLPSRLVREAQAAGFLTPEGIKSLFQDALRRKAIDELCAGAERVTAAGIAPMSLEEIQEEVNIVRAARKASARS